MKRAPYATMLISIIVAVALWSIATWLEDDSRWQLAPGEEPARHETPVRVDATPVGCDEAESALRAMVDNAQYCVSDDDCTLFDYGYPIQCLTSVAKAEITALRLEFRKYEESCDYRVYYDCPTGTMERQAVCRNNRCEVDLVTTEILQDETLEHLGIKDDQ